jgi:hypothetical protein
MKGRTLKKPKKAYIGLIVAAAKTAGEVAGAKLDTVSAAEENKLKSSDGYNFDVNKYANAKAGASFLNPVKGISEAWQDKDMNTAGKWATTLSSTGVGGGIANLFNKDLSTKEKVLSFIPGFGAKYAAKAAAKKKQEAMKKAYRDQQGNVMAENNAIAAQEDIQKKFQRSETTFRRGGVVSRYGWGKDQNDDNSSLAPMSNPGSDSAPSVDKGSVKLAAPDASGRKSARERNIAADPERWTPDKSKEKMNWKDLMNKAVNNFTTFGTMGLGGGLGAAKGASTFATNSKPLLNLPQMGGAASAVSGPASSLGNVAVSGSNVFGSAQLPISRYGRRIKYPRGGRIK